MSIRRHAKAHQSVRCLHAVLLYLPVARALLLGSQAGVTKPRQREANSLPCSQTLRRWATVQTSFAPADVFVRREMCTSESVCRPHVVGVFSPVPPDILPTKESASKLGDERLTCAIVGNSGTLRLGERHGKSIDEHDVVWRMNQAPTAQYEIFVGQKTTARLLNRLWTLGYASSRLVHSRYRLSSNRYPLEKQVTLLSSRTGTRAFKALHSAMRARRTDVKVRLLNNQLVVWSGEAVSSTKACLRKERRTSRQGGTTPSSGLVAIASLMAKRCANISVYGMGGHSGSVKLGGAHAPYQYYTLHGTQRSRGNSVHSFDVEKGITTILARFGHISLCAPSGCEPSRRRL